MLKEVTIKRYGEYEPMWLHIRDAGDKWIISHSRWHSLNARSLCMEYDKERYPTIESCAEAYIKACESYYSV